jgi:8-oxo-dGTP diphosphatase
MKRKPDLVMRMPVAVDLVVLTLRNDELAVLLIKRGIAPYLGRWALPGGFVRDGEDLTEAALRELSEETGIGDPMIGHIEQLATFGAVARDPRERVVSVAYLAFVPDLPLPVAGGDAGEAAIVPISALTKKSAKALALALAFDHPEILAMGIERCRAKLEYTSLATSFLGPEFTINELRKVYESVWGLPLDPGNFHRKVTKTEGFVQATQRMSQGLSGRPAQLFTQGDAHLLHPALLRG